MKKTNKIIAVMSAVAIVGMGTAGFSILTAQADDVTNISESIAEETTVTTKNNNAVVNYFETPSTTVNLKVAPENITDRKTLLTMIINSIDYFNTASGTFRETVAGQEYTATFVRNPASRAMDLTWTTPVWISGTSNSNRRFTRPGCVRDTSTCGPLLVLRTSRT